jgi:Glycosyl hydrolase catalytic core/GEVED domain/Ricin-type beta-trefoil lectin domain-like/Cadherin domain
MNRRPLRRARDKRKLAYESLETRQLLAVNLALFQAATADSQSGVNLAAAAVDGIVSNDSRWQSIGFGPHWLDVTLSAPYAVGSAHVYLGVDTGLTAASFSIHHFTGGAWVTAASVSNNTATEVKVPFASTVNGATRFRLYTTVGTIRVREFVLLPPGDFPLGTAVDLNLAGRRGPDVDSVWAGTNVGINAVDGWVSDNSRWLASDVVGPHNIDVHLVQPHLIGSLHLYSGVTSGSTVGSTLSSFTIEYANGTSGWLPISGGTVSSGTLTGNQVTGNTSGALAINFATPVTATSVRIGFSSAFGRIRELVVLPATAASDGSVGYPLGTSVKIATKPTTTFDQYGDSFFRLNSRVNSNALVSTDVGSSLLSGSTITEDNQYQLLYSYAMDAYRIRNRDTGKAIQVAGASTASGAAIVEGDFSASPHQLWRLIPTDSGYFQIVNVWSGMVLDVDVSGALPVVTQKVRDANTNPVNRQEWIPALVTHNTKKGTGGFVGQYGASWAYNWGLTTTAANDPAVLDKDFLFAPMQWGGGQTNANNLIYHYSDWHNNAKPQFLLGFNEPDAAEQSNITVERALELWPQLVAMDVPLLSPVNSDGHESWLESFADQADALGYRTDYTGMHWYSSPNINDVLNSIDAVQTKGNGRPVWLTEFSVVDWSNGSWSEETTYNFILELLWRLEEKTNLDKYAMFIWSGDSPTNPWDLANPRSNFRSNDGTLTPYGKAYAAWDNDTTIRNDTPYVLHNRGAVHRLANNGATNLNASTIRMEDASVQWQLRDAGSGKKYIVSGVDGRRLRFNGTALDFAPKGTTGTAVEWTISQEQYGWRNIVHPQTGKHLQLNRTNNSSNAPTALNFTMVAAASATTTASDWWFAKPYEPISDIGPVADSSTVVDQVPENSANGTVVGITASAIDSDPGQTVSYSLTDNAQGRFVVHSTTGVVTVAGTLNFETATSHSITVQAASSDGTTSSAVFTINVTDVNEAPSALNLSSTSFAENNLANAIVGTFSSLDPDSAQPFVYSLVAGVGSADNAAFSVSGDRLLANASFDQETQDTYNVRVRTTDSGGLWFERAFTISITDADLTRDFGDAPLPYPASGGHLAIGPRLGATRDVESGIQRSAAADGDGSDEDGVLFGIINTALGMAAVNIDLQNAATGRVDGWIDFNGDGDWSDAGEQILANTPVIGGIQTLNYMIPAGAVAGHTIARIRVSSSGALTPIATANDGEIEDYRVTIGSTPSVVVQKTVNNTNVTRSEVTSIAVDFDSVIPVQASDFILRNTTTNQTVTGITVQTQSNDGTTRATLTFTDGPSVMASTHASVPPSLANGAYTLRYLPSETLGDTTPIDAFFRKFGDADGNNLVALTDFATFRSSFGSSVGGANYRTDMDSNRDGVISLTDFAAFRSGFGS